MESSLDKHKPLNIPALFQVLISVIGFILYSGAAVILLLSGIVSFLEGGLPQIDLLPAFSMSWYSALFMLVMIPAFIYGFQKLVDKKAPVISINPMILLGIGAAIWVISLLIGWLLIPLVGFEWLLLPPIQIISIGLPIVLIISLARLKLSAGEPQRNWGIISFGLVITQPIVLFVEFVLIAVIAIVALFWASQQPYLLEVINQMITMLSSTNVTEEAALSMTQTFLNNPAVIYIMLSVIAGIIPLMEELLKPLAVWVFGGKNMTPRDGFIMGMIAGGTFALIESLGMLTSANPEWLVSVIGRMGTGLLHITTTALVGWGIASALHEKQYLRLGIGFLSAVFLHCIWNFFALLNGFSDYLSGSTFLQTMGNISVPVLIFLALLMAGVLVFMNLFLKKQSTLVDEVVEV